MVARRWSWAPELHERQRWYFLRLVTGASSGIGFELARQFAANGFDLLIAAEDAELLDAAEELRAAGAEVDALQVDLTSAGGVDELYARISATGRPAMRSR